MATSAQMIFGAIVLSMGVAGVTALASHVSIKVSKDQNAVPIGHKGDLERSQVRVIPLTIQPKVAMAETVKEPPPEPVIKPSDAVAEPVSPLDNPPVKHYWHVGDHIKGGDICQRHGGYKVETNHGKSWRCAFK